MEIDVVVTDEHGLHARPAAAFVQEAARHQASVKVSNLTTGRGPASARSLLAVLGLGVRQGHSVRLEAEGPEAEQSLAALSRLIAGEPAPRPAAESKDGEGGEV